MCVVSEILDNCCGNGLCELGEGNNCVSDCGPFTIQPTNFCEQCYALDGFMFDVGLSDSAEKRVFISSISFMHSSPTYTNATIDIFVTSSGSYVGQEYSVTAWERIRTMNVSAIDPGVIDITLDNFIPLGIGRKQGFYLAASENIVLFGEGVYSVKDENEVELFSSRAVTGTFGDGVDGFSLSCKGGSSSFV